MKTKEEAPQQWYARTELLIGEQRRDDLARKHVLVVGLGGVGAYAAELLCRAGIGHLTIVDADTVEPTNLNRQLPALQSTIGTNKTDVLRERLLDINPDVEIDARTQFLRDTQIDALLTASAYNYVVDAIDSITPKVHLIAGCIKRDIPVISSMGAGGKLDPGQVQVVDISQSHNCKLARVMRKRLHRQGIYTGVKVVFSPEDIPDQAVQSFQNLESGMNPSIVGTISYMPAIFGCYCTSVVIRDLLKG